VAAGDNGPALPSSVTKSDISRLVSCLNKWCRKYGPKIHTVVTFGLISSASMQ
jgi:hypothetical protein